MNKGQMGIYMARWKPLEAKLRAEMEGTKGEVAKALDRQRQRLHLDAGCPLSRKEWTSRDLDLWGYLECRINRPENLAELLEWEEKTHPEAGRIFHIRRLLKDLGKPVAYAAACTRQPDLSPNLCQWPASALQAALQALARTNRSQLPRNSGQ